MVTYKLPHRDTNIYLHKDFHQIIKEQIDFTMNDDQDTLILLDGNEGSGKSQTARQIGYVISKLVNTEFGEENIHQDAKSYIQHAARAEPGTVVILDEGRDVLNRRRAMSKSNTEFTNYTSRNRADNLFQLICVPSYHDLDSNIAKHRAKFLIHCFKHFDEDAPPSEYISGVQCVPGHYAVYDQGQPLRYHHEKGNYTYPENYVVRNQMNDAEPLTDEELEAYEEHKEDTIKSKYLEESESWKDEFLSMIDDKPDVLNSIKALADFVRDEQLMSKIHRKSEAVTVASSTFRGHIKDVSRSLAVDDSLN